MNVIHFTGNVGKDAEIRSVNGTDVCNFSVAVRQGFNRDARSEWYRVAVWGQRGNTIAQHITKGAKVAVCGDLEIGEYNGKPQFNVRAHDVDPFCGGKRDEQRGQGEGNGFANDTRSQGGGGTYRQPAPAFDSDLDDSVPF